MKSISAFLGVSVLAAQSLSAQRPQQYPSAWGQFDITHADDHRRVCIFRLGAGAARRAEAAVFEIVSQGAVLRLLFHRELMTEMTWWQAHVLGNGRYIVTMNDRFIAGKLEEQPAAGNKHAIVMYDLFRGKSAAFRNDQFLTPEFLRIRDGDLDGCYGSSLLWNPRLDLLYICDPGMARHHGFPFLVLDLPALEVLSLPAPTVEEEARVRLGLVDVRADVALWWDYSQGSEQDPDWNTPLQLPRYLKARTPLSDAPVSSLGIDANVLYFKRDAASGDYMRCSVDQWVQRPTSWDRAVSR
jgi:hypothetical protein